MGKEAQSVVRLTADERQSWQGLVSGARSAADRALRARLLGNADREGDARSDTELAEAFEVGWSTIPRLRQRWVEDGLEAAWSRRPRSSKRPTKRDGAEEARLIAIACGPAPEGRARWTWRRLADPWVELEGVDSIGTEAVRQTRTTTSGSLGGIDRG